MGDRNVVAAGLLIAIGLAMGGYFVGDGLFAARSTERYVTVKGLAEREVAANLVIWPITYAVTADDLGTLQRRTDDGATKIRAFLAADFDGDEISIAASTRVAELRDGTITEYLVTTAGAPGERISQGEVTTVEPDADGKVPLQFQVDTDGA